MLELLYANNIWHYLLCTPTDRSFWASVFMCHRPPLNSNKMKSKPTQDQGFQDCKLKGWRCTWVAGNPTKLCSVLVRVCIFQQYCCCILSEHHFSLVCIHLLLCFSVPATPPIWNDSYHRSLEENSLTCGIFFLHGLLYSILVTVHSRLAKKQSNTIRSLMPQLLLFTCVS